jgi:threonine aldolase
VVSSERALHCHAMAERIIDLRSDTVTKPSEGMRRAMAAADVGDDVYLEDPTAKKLQERAAEVLGKEASLFVPTGTMANQIAVLIHCRPGDEVIVSEGAHCYFYESGAGAALAGAQFMVAGTGGTFTADEMEAACKPPAYYLPRTRMVGIENTHNRAGGKIFPQDQVVAIAERARGKGLAVHIDGARIWNAHVATGIPVATLTAPADSASACFSKGLGAPAGSVIAGSKDFIDQARRLRKMLGGGMRQVGVLCAAALYALDNHLSRLPEDHANAKRLADRLGQVDGISCLPVPTNIVIFDVAKGTAAEFVARAAKQGVLMNAIGPRRIRAVTHLDVRREDADAAGEILARAAG